MDFWIMARSASINDGFVSYGFSRHKALTDGLES